MCRYLTTQGYDVIAMSRKENERLNDIVIGGHLQVLYADMQNIAEKTKDVRADVFIHLAWAGVLSDQRGNRNLQQDNIRYSSACVYLSRRMGCQLYIDAGSQAEYGIVPGIITEETECHPVTAYGQAKLEMYRHAREITKKLGLKYIHLRIFSVYGKYDHPNTLIMSSLQKLKNNEVVEIRSGGQMWNYVYVKDAARQIGELALFAIDNEVFECEVYNIASEDTRKLREFVEVMKEICDSKSELRFGGYNPEKDVNLNPDMRKTMSIVKPLTRTRFEEILKGINV